MLQKIKGKIRSKFFQHILIAVSGTAGAQAISMAFIPVITRLYGPEAYGLLGTFLAFFAILSPIAALAYPVAIVLPKKDTEAKRIARLSLIVAFGVSIAVLAIFMIAGESIVSLLQMDSISNFLLLIPLAMFFAGVQQILQQWLIRKKQFQIYARVAVFQALIFGGLKTVIGFFAPLGKILIFLTVISQVLYAIQMWVACRDKIGINLTFKNKKIGLKNIAYKYRDFPSYRAPEMFINAVSQGLPVLMLASFFGPASAGFYTLARTVVGMPSALIGNAIGDVLYPRINEAALEKENIFNLILKSTFALSLIAIIPFGSLVAAGPWLFTLVFGENWAVAGEYVRWLAVWMFFGFANLPSVRSLPVLKLQRFYFGFSIFTIFLRILALYVGIQIFSSDIKAIAIYAFSGAIINGVLIFLVLILSRRLFK